MENKINYLWVSLFWNRKYFYKTGFIFYQIIIYLNSSKNIIAREENMSIMENNSVLSVQSLTQTDNPKSILFKVGKKAVDK